VYEVEMKFPVVGEADTEARLLAIGARPAAALAQLDRYFAHPCRDFAVTDEALRLRQVGDTTELTYKGPRIDATTKTRRELSVPLASMIAGDAGGRTVATWTALLVALGFHEVATVAKRRRPFALERDGHDVEIALDAVEGLGTFVELELVADEGGIAAARACLASVAAELELARAERRSYLELLLQAGTAPAGELPRRRHVEEGGPFRG
jgi:adenylate cyclase class 2